MMMVQSGMSIRSRYLVPKITIVAGTGTNAGTGTQAAVIPAPNTGKIINFGRPVPVLPKYQNW
jgi:Mg/Co/Ni transporter MgtE